MGDLETAEVFEDPVPRDLTRTAFVDCAAFNNSFAALCGAIRPPAAKAAACIEEGAFVVIFCAACFLEVFLDMFELLGTLNGVAWAGACWICNGTGLGTATGTGTGNGSGSADEGAAVFNPGVAVPTGA